MEVQGIAMFNTVAVPAASQQNEPRPSQQDAWNPASVHVPETLRYQATDMIGGSPGLKPARTFLICRLLQRIGSIVVCTLKLHKQRISNPKHAGR